MSAEPKVGMVAQAFRMERDAYIERAHAAEARVAELEARVERMRDTFNKSLTYEAENARLRDGINAAIRKYAFVSPVTFDLKKLIDGGQS